MSARHMDDDFPCCCFCRMRGRGGMRESGPQAGHGQGGNGRHGGFGTIDSSSQLLQTLAPGEASEVERKRQVENSALLQSPARVDQSYDGSATWREPVLRSAFRLVDGRTGLWRSNQRERRAGRLQRVKAGLIAQQRDLVEIAECGRPLASFPHSFSAGCTMARRRGSEVRSG